MVAHPGKPVRAARLRPLGQPRPLAVRADADGRPLAVGQGRAALPVAAIRDQWRVDEGWWREGREIRRRYYQVVLADGRCLTLFQDLLTGEWRRQGD